MHIDIRTHHGARRLSAAVIATGLAVGLSFSLGVAPVHADKLDDRKDRIDKRVKGTQQDLESVNAMLQKNGKKLQGFQDRLPGAQKALAEAEAAESSARQQAEELQGRLASAEQSRAEMVSAQKKTNQQSEAQRKMTGQLAARAYQSGGFDSGGLGVLAGGADMSRWASSVEMSSRLARSQNQHLNKLLGQQAEQRNAATRLGAVEDQISDLKQKADAALERQTEARQEADAAKAKLDRLLKDTETAQSDLKTAKSEAKDKLKAQEEEQASVNRAIKERQERLKREAAERARKARAAAKKAAQQAAAAERRKAANAAALRSKAQRANSSAKKATYNATPSGSVSKGSWGLIVPSTSGPITSRFGWRPTPAGTIDYGGMGGYVHAGLDWGSQCGAPIKAAASGRVVQSGHNGSHGITVSLDHNVVRGHALTTNYNHMTRTAVSAGQHVKQGQVVGYVGTTGNSTGCHLHFETVVDGSHRNPESLLW